MYFFNAYLFTELIPPTADLAARFAGATGDQTYAAALFHTGWFVESLFTQTLIVHVIRTRKIPFIQSRASLGLTMTTLIAVLIAGILPYTGTVAAFLGLVPLPAIFWLWLAAFLLAYIIITHNVKTWFFKKFGVD